jgi:hypothetical protein
MNIENVGSNAILIAKQFNPSIIRDFWLVDNGLLSRDDFLPGCVHTDAFVNVRSRRFSLVVVPDQLQFVPIGEPEELQDIVVEKLGAIVRTLPHTPFSAVGLNFVWHVRLEDESIEEVTRGMFAAPDHIPLHRAFLEPDAKFGAYCSKDALGCRLKLDVKPIIVKEENRIQFAFNFHLGLPQEGSADEQIVETFRKWDEARSLSAGMIEDFTRREAEHA